MTDLENKIIKYAKAYYEGESLIPDSEFDSLIDLLKQENPDSFILHSPGWGYIPEPGELKEKHLGLIVGSLDKIKHGEITESSYIFNSYNSLHVLTPKLDGNSVVAYYYNGRLKKILSRGDGTHGINITKNLQHAVPNTIDNENNYIIGIRGEAILSYEDFEGMEGSNPRNKCAGLLQSKNANKQEIEKIQFVPYQITVISIPDDKWKLKINHFRFFEENGFLLIPYEIIYKSELYRNHLTKEYVQDYLTQINNHHLPVDGVVINKSSMNFIKIDDLIALDCEGIAFKYPDETKETVVEDIKWNMTNNSRFVPVLKIKEIEIDGIKINNVTGNNLKWIQDRKCGIGSKLEIKRSNECIPNIHSVVDKSDVFNNPSTCYVCGSNLTLDKYEVNLICPNNDCEAKDIAIIYKIWEFIKPDGASDACFKILIDKIKGTNILYTCLFSPIITQCNLYFRNNDLWDTNPENHYYKLVKQALINFSNMKATIPEIIKMSNINAVGKTIGERIEQNLNYSVDKFLEYIKDNNGFPSEIFKYKELNDYKNNLQKVVYIWDGKIVSNKNNKSIRVAITGSVSKSRGKWFKEMEQHGIKKSGVTKDCDYLICNNPSNSSSYKKAVEYGIPILSENEFLEKMGIT